MRAAMALSQEKGFTRMPVWQGEGAAKRITGVLSVRAALYREDFNPERRAENYVRPAVYFDEDLRLETALARLQRGGERVAIVLDRNRKEIGLICLQDILNSVFGEVHL